MITKFATHPPYKARVNPDPLHIHIFIIMETNTQNLAEDDEHIFRSRFPAVPVPDITLPEFVLQDAESYAGKVAFVETVTGKEVTYGDVVRDTRRFSKALSSLGLSKGDVVIVVLPNVAEYAIITLGIMAAGGVFSAANPTAHASEIKNQVEAAEAKLIVTNGPSYEKVIILV
jgi:4-coumarate--CoA ligase